MWHLRNYNSAQLNTHGTVIARSCLKTRVLQNMKAIRGYYLRWKAKQTECFIFVVLSNCSDADNVGYWNLFMRNLKMYIAYLSGNFRECSFSPEHRNFTWRDNREKHIFTVNMYRSKFTVGLTKNKNSKIKILATTLWNNLIYFPF